MAEDEFHALLAGAGVISSTVRGFPVPLVRAALLLMVIPMVRSSGFCSWRPRSL